MTTIDKIRVTETTETVLNIKKIKVNVYKIGINMK